MPFKKKNKIFCIGLNKTGTTSLGYFLESENFIVADQRKGELLLQNYIDRDFASIIDYVKNSKANVFQDVPFSLPYTYSHLDNAFPNSKFILTIRNSSELWYNSIYKFHSEMYNAGKLPTKESLQNAPYVYPGWSWQLMRDVFFIDEHKLYDKVEFLNFYENYLGNVKKYFRNKPEQLIVIDLSIKEDYKRLCEFLNISSQHKEFPKITSSDLLSMNYNCNFLTSD